VADFTLTASAALDGYDKDHGTTRLRELTALAMVSIALPLNNEARAQKAIEAAFGTPLPAVGQSVMSQDGLIRLARLGQDQHFAFFTHAAADAEPLIAARLDGAGFTTDQSDVWVGLEISGPMARATLERICPLDLHGDVFTQGNVARTVMEHLGTLILRVGPDTFILLSARSSARSFLHAIETSIRNLL